MKAFLYARVSTGEQDSGMQVREMEEFSKRRGWDPELFADAGWSGTSSRRPALDRMLEQVRKRRCDVVLVYRFDRFARSLQFLIEFLQLCKKLSIQFISLHENIDTTLPHGELLFHIFGAIAQFERSLIAERVRSGMAHARANGTHIGRPSLGLDPQEIATLRAQGLRWTDVAEKVGAGISTCKKTLRKAGLKGLCKTPKRGADSKALEQAVENTNERA